LTIASEMGHGTEAVVLESDGGSGARKAEVRWDVRSVSSKSTGAVEFPEAAKLV